MSQLSSDLYQRLAALSPAQRSEAGEELLCGFRMSLRSFYF